MIEDLYADAYFPTSACFHLRPHAPVMTDNPDVHPGAGSGEDPEAVQAPRTKETAAADQGTGQEAEAERAKKKPTKQHRDTLAFGTAVYRELNGAGQRYRGPGEIMLTKARRDRCGRGTPSTSTVSTKDC